MTNTRLNLIIFQVLFILIVINVINGKYTSADDPYFHVNFKRDELMEPETIGDLNYSCQEIYTEADYTDVGGVRLNKEWVQVGKWESHYREFDSNISFHHINIWHRYEQEEGQDAEPEFMIEFNINGILEFSYTYIEDDPGDDTIREFVGYIDYDNIINKDDYLEIYFNYSGYEDIVIYCDNATFDTGFKAKMNLLYVFDYLAKGNQITLEIFDIFNSDWNEVKFFIDIQLNRSDIRIDRIDLQKIHNRTVEGVEIESTKITWTFNESLQEGESVSIWIKYTIAEKSEDKGQILECIAQSHEENNGNQSISNNRESKKWYDQNITESSKLNLIIISIIGAFIVSMAFVKFKRNE